jgi:integrase
MKFVKVITKPSGLRFVYYAKPGCKRARLPDLPENDPAFLIAYAEAVRGAVRAPSRLEPGEGTIAALCVSYQRSLAFRGLRDATRQTRGPALDRIAAKAGRALVADLAPRHIRRDIAALSPHAANNRLKVWRVLMNHAIDLDLIETNPARDVKRRKTPPGGYHCWTDDEIAQFRAHHASGTKARLAFEVALWTGARRGDLVRLGRQNISGGSLSYTSQKTRIEVCIPVLAEAQAEIDQAPGGEMLFLPAKNGEPYDDHLFGQWFQRRCHEAGLPSFCSLHGLRKARARIMAEVGATTHAIAAWGGWKTLGEVAHYTAAADRRKLTHAGTEQKQKLDNPTDPVVDFLEKPNEINGST